MTLRVITVTWALAVAVGLYLFLRSNSSEVLVAQGATLTTGWAELRPKNTMRTSGDRSELYVELLDLRENKDGDYKREDGSSPFVEAYLISNSGEKFILQGVQGGIGLIRVLRLSNPALEWKQRNYKFQSVSLRADRPMKVGRIVWISYDPQSTKSGVKDPDAFDKD